MNPKHDQTRAFRGISPYDAQRFGSFLDRSCLGRRYSGCRKIVIFGQRRAALLSGPSMKSIPSATAARKSRKDAFIGKERIFGQESLKGNAEKMALKSHDPKLVSASFA
jgi:hypothetical protein